jgi:hypothetical protein
LWRRLPLWWGVVWWRLLSRRLWLGRLGLGWRLWLGSWVWLLRLWLGGVSRHWRAVLLRRLWVLRICPGLRCTCVRRSDVCCASLHHNGLCQAGLHFSSLYDGGCPDDAGSRNCSRREYRSGNAARGHAGVCFRSRCELHTSGLRHVGEHIGLDGFARHLCRGPERPDLDAAARPASRSDLQLDDSRRHNGLLRCRSVVGPTPLNGRVSVLASPDSPRPEEG